MAWASPAWHRMWLSIGAVLKCLHDINGTPNPGRVVLDYVHVKSMAIEVFIRKNYYG